MINIFNPVRVFKDELSSSWATNIKTNKKKSNNIPINKNVEPPTLVLDALPDVEYFIGVLPIYRSWAPTDISGYESLKFNITTSRVDYPDVKISLVSQQDDKSKEVDSEEISLAEYGLMSDCEQEFNVPLKEFGGDDFDLSKVRSLKIIGGGKFTIALSGIVIE